MTRAVTGHRMEPVDAQFFWMSAKLPNDEFLLYAFDGEPADYAVAVEQVLGRARACPQLVMRVEDRNPLTYPRWVPMAVTPDQVIRHHLADNSWDGCLTAVAALADNQLNIRETPWRIHIFSPVLGIPGVDGAGTIAVMQAPHALADGIRGAAMAAWLFGRTDAVPAARPLGAGFAPWRALEAARSHRQLVRDTRAGLLARGVGPWPLLPTNARPEGARSVRTLVRHRSQLRPPTVTVGVLTAVSTALSNLLGNEPDSLGAEVPVAKTGVPRAQNHFGNVAVGLYPRLGLAERAERIATDLDNGRRRSEHPAIRCADRAFASVPAAVLRWGVAQFDPAARPPRVSGNTVVSSVNRGAADLTFGGARVALTAGYPGLTPAMALTHGVHGIGDTVAISVHASASAFQREGTDIDTYARLLDAAL